MTRWPPYPAIYEINTWVFLSELRARSGAAVTLGSVPAAEWDAIASLGFDAVWLMGVWERSAAGIGIANHDEGLLGSFWKALPDYGVLDNVGSPYCVRRYVVDPRLGGPEGLAAARRELASRGVRLLLDFVPNHVAPDHPWVLDHPGYFIQGSADDVREEPAAWITAGERVLACGRDPSYPAWPDVVQLNAFDPELRQAAIRTLASVAQQCDGVRCDMAMLVLNATFERTWGERAGPRPPLDYWREVIPAVRKRAPDFLFVAESYWDLEWELQQQGFDFCYDKTLYERLLRGSPESVWLHLCADPAFQGRLLRFLENHDEPRAAAVFPPQKERVAAVVLASVPGARLLHDGQLEGRKVKLPVFLGRRPQEPVDRDLLEFHGKLLRAVDAPVFKRGSFELCECRGWPDNPTHLNLVAWTRVDAGDRRLVVVNLSGAPAQARVELSWNDLRGARWTLVDPLAGESFDRDGIEMRDRGLFVDLPAFGFHFLKVDPA